MADILVAVKAFIQPYLLRFKQYPTWKQALISSGIIIGSSIFYTIGSYNISKILYNQIPRIDYTVSGDINNNNGIIFLLHGWPDSPALWTPQINFLSSKNYCCINLELPNFDVNKIQSPWGYDLISVINALGNEMIDILSSNNKLDESIIILAHDWGAALMEDVYIKFKNKMNISKLILLDVGDGADPSPKEQPKYFYQFVNAVCFCLPRAIGTWYLQRYFKRISKCTFPAFRREKYVDSVTTYLYFYYIKMMLLRQTEQLKNVAIDLEKLDGIPILFICAGKGWLSEDVVKYYSPDFKKFIEERDYCKFVTFHDCYHHLQDEIVGNPQKLNNEIYQFLQK